MSQPPPHQQDTGAWVFQAWASFLIALATTGAGIIYLPVDGWVRGFLGMGLLFTVNACFTLAKTVRDNHEAGKFINRLTGAKAEKLLQEFEGRSPLS
jgi:hypothetical protein